jgi:hypothetical protein
MGRRGWMGGREIMSDVTAGREGGVIWWGGGGPNQGKAELGRRVRHLDSE